MYDEFCACLTQNPYYKVFVVTVLGLAITFIEDLDALHNQWVGMSVLCVFLIMCFCMQQDDFGTILLLLILCVLVYNMDYTRKRVSKSS
jgi:cell division protein FtsW (lipid II flippase)